MASGNGLSSWWIVAAVVVFALLFLIVTSSQEDWANQERHCKAFDGVWLSGRDLHKCLYGVREHS